MKTRTRVLSFLLTLAMLLPMISIPTFAEEASNVMYSESFDGKTLDDVLAGKPSSAVITAADDAAHGDVLRISVEGQGQAEYYLWTDQNNKWPITDAVVADGKISGTTDKGAVVDAPIPESLEDTEKTYVIDETTYKIVTGAYADSRGGAGNVATPAKLKNPTIAIAEHSLITVEMDLYLPEGMKNSTGISGRMQGTKAATGGGQNIELFEITSDGTKAMIKSHENSTIAYGEGMTVALGAWVNLMLEVDFVNNHVSVLVNGVFAFRTANLNSHWYEITEIKENSLQVQIDRGAALPSQNVGYVQYDNIAIKSGACGISYDPYAIKPMTVDFENFEVGEDPTSAFYSINTITSSSVDDSYGSKAWRIDFERTNGTNVLNIDKNQRLKNPMVTYEVHDKVVYETDYFFVPGASGQIQSQFTNSTARVNGLEERSSVSWVDIYQIAFGDGVATLKFETVAAGGQNAKTYTFSTDQWVTVSAVIDLDTGLYDMYIDGELAIGGVQLYRDGNLTDVSISANYIIPGAKVNKIDGKGTFLLDNIKFYGGDKPSAESSNNRIFAAVDFADAEIGQAPTEGFATLGEIEGSAVADTYGRPAWKIDYERTDGVNVKNIDKNPRLSSPAISYLNYRSIRFEAEYFFEADATGRFETQFRTVNARVGRVDDTAVSWVNLYSIDLSEGRAKVFLANHQLDAVPDDFALMDTGRWNTVSVVIDLVNGTRDIYINGVLGIADAPMYENGRLANISVAADALIPAKINKVDGKGSVQVGRLSLEAAVLASTAPEEKEVLDFEEFIYSVGKKTGVPAFAERLPALTTYASVNGDVALRIDTRPIASDDTYMLIYSSPENGKPYSREGLVWDPQNPTVGTVDGTEYSFTYNSYNDTYYTLIDGVRYYAVTEAVAEIVIAGWNVARASYIKHKEFSWLTTEKVLLEANYFIEEGSTGIIESQFDAFTYMDGAETGSFIQLFRIELDSGRFDRTETYFNLGEWNNVKVYLNLVDGTYDIHVNGEFAEQKQVTAGENNDRCEMLTIGSSSDQFWSVAKVKRQQTAVPVPERWTGAIYVDDISVSTVTYASSHTWNGGEVLSTPTHSAEGVIRYTCTECNESYDVKISVIETEFSEWESYDEEKHVRKCLCGNSFCDGMTEYAAHDWQDGICGVCRAETPKTDGGVCGENVTWEFEYSTGTLSIKGSGATFDYSEGAPAPWSVHAAIIKNVVVGSGITLIGSYAFYQCTNLVDVDISNSTVNIGDYAFANCDKLEIFKMPDTVTLIGKYAFYQCTNLVNINISNSTVNIGDYAFSNCESITEIVLPHSVEVIGESAFEGCGALSDVKFAELAAGVVSRLEVIGDRAFADCGVLESFAMPDSVKLIGKYAFYQCANLVNINISNSVVTIGEYAFSDCRKVTRVIIPASAKEIQKGAFSRTGIVEIEIPQYIEVIESYVFFECVNLINITISDSVIKIGDHAFAKCTHLKEITIPAAVEDLGESAFEECEGLSKVVFKEGSKVTVFKTKVFYRCISLVTITISNSVIQIGDYVFGGSGITTITLPESVTTIGAYAFFNCSNLVNINISNSEIVIGEHAFSDCEMLTDVIFCGTESEWEELKKENGPDGVNVQLHDWDSGKVTGEPSCGVVGEMLYTCSKCGATKTEEIPALAHPIWGEWEPFDGASHVHECSCGEVAYAPHLFDMGTVNEANGTVCYTCEECGYTYSEELVCEHSMIGAVTKEATHKTTGVLTHTCSKCGETETETIPVVPVQYGAWTELDGENHVRDCICGNAWCDADAQSAPHAWNAGEMIAHATHKREGMMTYTCTECSATYTVAIPTVDARYGEWKEFDGENHVRDCTCGVSWCDADAQYAPHGWNAGEVTAHATHKREGVMTYTCTECSATYTEAIPTVDVRYGEWEKLDGENQVRDCVCGNAWCDADAQSAPHTWNGGVITALATHKREGVKTYTCVDCHTTRTEAIPTVDVIWGVWERFDEETHIRACICGNAWCDADAQSAPHTWNGGVITTAPTLTGEGVKTYTCTVCRETKTEVLPVLSSQISVGNADAVVGETVRVPIVLSGNPGVWAVAFEVGFDEGVFEFVDADVSESVFDSYGICGYDETTKTYKFNACNSDPFRNVETDGVICVLILKVKANAAVGDHAISLTVWEKNTVNIAQEAVDFAVVNGAVSVKSYVLGDVNGDREVTNADVLLIFRYIYNAELYPLPIGAAGDVNRDGFVTNADVLLIFRYIYNSDLYPLV